MSPARSHTGPTNYETLISTKTNKKTHTCSYYNMHGLQSVSVSSKLHSINQIKWWINVFSAACWAQLQIPNSIKLITLKWKPQCLHVLAFNYVFVGTGWLSNPEFFQSRSCVHPQKLMLFQLKDQIKHMDTSAFKISECDILRKC